MCLKYFVGYSSCDHHEYLGSHHCSLRPCALDSQHFYYIEDGFPVPWPEGVQSKHCVLACNICASQRCDKLDPDETPVQPYAPTNDFQVKEIQCTAYVLPIQVVRAEEDDTTTEETGSEDIEDVFDYDYKSLSDAEDDEWDLQQDTYRRHEGSKTRSRGSAQRHRDCLQSQLRDLPKYLMHQRQSSPFVLPGTPAESYPTWNYFHYPMPHMVYLAPPLAPWHGGMTLSSSIHSEALPTGPDGSSPQFLPALIPWDAGKRTAPPSLPPRPVTPPSTPPMHLLSPQTTPPFFVGSITDTYLRMEAAKRRHMRERERRRRSSLRDALPVRSMALTEFMVEKRTQRGHRKQGDTLEDGELDMWSSLPFAGEDLDTECGAEGDSEIPGFGSENVMSGFSW